jgi:uncharacterized protein (DUF488 family)
LPRILTVGHSTRSLDELVELLRHHRVGVLVDVRTVPASRRMPHFGRASLQDSMPAHGIEYIHVPQLGGLRKAEPESINSGWRNVSFRGYADHMQTDEFWNGIERLTSLPSGQPAIMCAEAVPWRCHRSLISDALTVRGWMVGHITGTAQPSPHSLTPFTRVANGRISYPPPDTLPI